MFASVYFVLLIITGGFFLLNIALAVVWDAFSTLSRREPRLENRTASGRPTASCLIYKEPVL